MAGASVPEPTMGKEPATEFGKRNRYLEKLIPDAIENAVDAMLPDAFEKALDRGVEKAYRKFTAVTLLVTHPGDDMLSASSAGPSAGRYIFFVLLSTHYQDNAHPVDIHALVSRPYGHR